MAAEVIVLDASFAIHQLKSTDLVPPEVFRSRFYWIGRTGAFLSLICDESLELQSADSSPGWRCLNIRTGDPVLPELAQNLRQSGLAFVPLPSGDGAYGLIPNGQLDKAREQLDASGYRVADHSTASSV